MSLARGLLLAAIHGYKRHVSPRKGFACAIRVREGCASCSTLGVRAISRYGAWRGLGVLRLRLEQCRLVAEEQRSRRRTPGLAQAGFVDCDLPCDGACIDASTCDGCALGQACEFASCASCDGFDDCDWWPGSKDSQTAAVRRRRRRGEPVAGEPAPDAPPDS